MLFKRSVQRYGRTPEPDTPFHRAGQLWDERIGSARVQARNWRLMAFGGLALTTAMSGALIWQSLQSRVTPYVVEVDRLQPLRDGIILARSEERKLLGLQLTGRAGQRRPSAARGRGLPHEVLVGDELVAVALQDHARECAAADDEHLLVVLLQLLDEGQEVAVAADDDEGVDVGVGERHLERIEREIDVGAVLVAARRHLPLHHAHGVLRHLPAVITGALPVAVGHLGDDLATLLDGLEDGPNVELGIQRRLDANFNVVEIDKNGDLQFLV